ARRPPRPVSSLHAGTTLARRGGKPCRGRVHGGRGTAARAPRGPAGADRCRAPGAVDQRAKPDPAVAPAFPLADVEPNWARESIQRLVEAGVAQGYPDGTFRPDQPIPRAQFAQMAARAFQLEPGPDFVFADAQDHPARRELAMLVSYGALAAERDTTIAPEKPLTRAEAARALVALLGLTTLEGRDRRAEGIAFEYGTA